MVTKAKMLGSIPGKTFQMFHSQIAGVPVTIVFGLKILKKSVNVKDV